ncbi:methylglyoxal synthase [Devosia geojensis]|uniref:Methylglyoxal synthase n=1 Tax=Devosia geojensis TaxID=443610 RepID=A0A0F5FS95_9HYPH|nr:methylglyoxal synthase [Devosia geojensis]KKB11022.1 methylglyoxal synthase [Devosia geojensis]
MARIGLVAHDDKKADMAEWAAANAAVLSRHTLYATGTTGGRVREETGLEVALLKSGPLGGDQQLGAMIAEGKLDALVFFIDPLTALPHDVDVKALTRLATLYDTLFACNRSTADAVLKAL